MNTLKHHSAVGEISDLTIPEAEEIIEDALEGLEYSADPAIKAALHFLAPAGYQVIVELCGENGRSKRRGALAATWNPEEDEIRIYFERIDGEDDHPEGRKPGLNGNGYGNAAVSHASRGSGHAANGNTANGNAAHGNNADERWMHEPPASLPADVDDQIRELCAALAEAERGGHAFIALKWFRDSFLPRKTFRWNLNPESRQLILAEAIQRGVVSTSKIPNPKTPAYPTTTIRLNRAEAGIAEDTQRFRPVSEQSASLLDILEEDRGARG